MPLFHRQNTRSAGLSRLFQDACPWANVAKVISMGTYGKASENHGKIMENPYVCVTFNPSSWTIMTNNSSSPHLFITSSWSGAYLPQLSDKATSPWMPWIHQITVQCGIEKSPITHLCHDLRNNECTIEFHEVWEFWDS